VRALYIAPIYGNIDQSRGKAFGAGLKPVFRSFGVCEKIALNDDMSIPDNDDTVKLLGIGTDVIEHFQKSG
jgi:hypothetical protein